MRESLVKRWMMAFVWIGIHIGLFIYEYFEEQGEQNTKDMKKMLSVYFLIARASAKCLNFDLSIILIPICRNLISILRRIPYLSQVVPFDKHLKFHAIIAYTLAFFAAVHTVAHYFNFMLLERATGGNLGSLLLNYGTWAGLTGVSMNLILILIITSSTKVIRDQAFELFWYTHHLFVPFFFAAVTHAFSCLLKFDNGECFNKTTWIWAIPGLFFLSIELILRIYRAHQETQVTKVIQHPSRTFEIQFYKPSMKTLPGQYVFVNIPQVSKTEWHPFTLTSCSSENIHSIHVRVVGDWTENVAKVLGCMNENGEWVMTNKPKDASKLINIRIDGPLGTPSMGVFDHEVAVLIGAGIGVTPFASILKEIWHTVHEPGYSMKLKKVLFIWISRDTESFEWFQDLLSHMEASNVSNFLEIQIYLTGALDKMKNLNIIVNGSTSNKLDPITRLRTQTRFGRPNIESIFQLLKTRYRKMGTDNMGVFFCGPGGLGHRIRMACEKTTDSSFKMHFAKEIF